MFEFRIPSGAEAFYVFRIVTARLKAVPLQSQVRTARASPTKFLRCRRLHRLRRMRGMKYREQDPDHHKYQHTAFRTYAPPGQPRRTLKRGGQIMSLNHSSAVRHAVKIAFRPVPGRMQAYGKPQVSRAPYREAKEQSNQPCR